MGVPADVQVPDLSADLTPGTPDLSPDPELRPLGHSRLPPRSLDFSASPAAPWHARSGSGDRCAVKTSRMPRRSWSWLTGRNQQGFNCEKRLIGSGYRKP